MNLLPTNVLYYGEDKSLPARIPLRAGALSMIFEEGDLRYIRLNDRLILLRLYISVRNHNWDTVLPVISNLEIERQPDSFTLRFRADHQKGNIHFGWNGTITGNSDSTLTVEMDGEILSTFKRNRIGFCVLHPSTLAGQACVIEHTDGTVENGIFPDDIDPHQAYFNLRVITHEVIPGVQAEVRMEGDAFEMEDQRNWSDASYKIYCTPLERPFPVEVKTGDKISQRVQIKLSGDIPESNIASDEKAASLHFEIGEVIGKLPAIGLSVKSDATLLTPTETDRLAALNLAYIRCDLALDAAPTDLESALSQLSYPNLELALHVTDNAEQELRQFRTLLDKAKPAVVRWLIFHKGDNSTDAKWVQLARQILGDTAAQFGTGSLTNFTELNRERPDTAALDVVAYAMNPQRHSFDNAALVETLPIHGVTVQNAKKFAGKAGVAVGPVTFKGGLNPVATSHDGDEHPNELPAQVDVRQMSLFGAGWTVGSIKYLAEAGATSITYYQILGWLGVMETEAGSPLPEQYRSIPGGVFPVYHALADINAYAAGHVRKTTSSDPIIVEGIALALNHDVRVVLANFTAETQRVTVTGIRGAARVQSLDKSNAESAMREPEAFRTQQGTPMQAGIDGLGLTIDLLPFALVRIDSRQ